jgi:hypothetical protein
MRYAHVKCLCWKEVTNTSFKKVDGELFRTKEVQQGNVAYEIECSIGEGLSGLFLIGMKEHETIIAKEIIRAAIKKQGFIVPKARIVVSIRLIDDPKSTLSAEVIGPSLLSPDRKVASAIAVAILAATGQMRELKDGEYVVGNELTLDGRMIPSPDAMDDEEVTLREYVEAINSAQARAFDRCPNCHDLLTSIIIRKEEQVNADDDGTFDLDCSYSMETKFYCPGCNAPLLVELTEDGFRVKGVDGK